ncbi:MAG: beta-lactamase family protein [Bacilli bacterium]|nr:beta-lactamase family protein [Bacilli bacterium]
MNYIKLMDNFLDDVKEDYPYINSSYIREVCSKIIPIIYVNKDADEYEIIDRIIQDDLDYVNEIFSKNIVPGYTIGINEGNINIKYFGGKIDSNNLMTENTLFDIASMSKMYTQVILYNLIKDGYFDLDDNIYDLDNRFVNLKDVTVRELMSFSIDLFTPGNMTLMENVDDAKEALFNIGVKSRGKYVYSDFGLMIMKEVAEKVTGKTYKELLKELGLKETVVDELDKYTITGSANQDKLAVNDPKAISVGGYSGHAGIFASSDGIIDFYKKTQDGILLDKEGLSWATEANELVDNRGKLFGNTFVIVKEGLKNSFVDNLSPRGSYATQGSTRTQGVATPTGASTVLTNPASISLEEAIEFENRFNEKLIKQGKNPQTFVKNLKFNRDGIEEIYHMIDARRMIDLDNITHMNAITSLRLRFLNNYFKVMDSNREIDIVKNMNRRTK